MLRTAAVLALAALLSLLACSQSPTDPADRRGAPTSQPAPDLPSVPTTAVLAFVSTRDGGEHIYVANADGSGVTRVTAGRSPAWSWNGRRIAFVRQTSAEGAIYVLDIVGRYERYLSPGKDPAWLPDGRVVFEHVDAFHAINADGSGAVELLDAAELWADFGYVSSNGWRVPSHIISHPTPSPDGQNIAFRWAQWTGGGPCIGIVSLVRSDHRNLEALCPTALGSGPVLSPPVWAPDGSAVAAFTGHGRVCSPVEEYPLWSTCTASHETSVAYAYDLASADREPIYVTPPRAHADSPDWSPDGSHFVFDANVSMGPALVRRIFIGSLETGEVRRLIPPGGHRATNDYEDYDPAWSRVVR